MVYLDLRLAELLWMIVIFLCTKNRNSYEMQGNVIGGGRVSRGQGYLGGVEYLGEGEIPYTEDTTAVVGTHPTVMLLCLLEISSSPL